MLRPLSAPETLSPPEPPPEPSTIAPPRFVAVRFDPDIAAEVLAAGGDITDIIVSQFDIPDDEPRPVDVMEMGMPKAALDEMENWFRANYQQRHRTRKRRLEWMMFQYLPRRWPL